MPRAIREARFQRGVVTFGLSKRLRQDAFKEVSRMEALKEEMEYHPDSYPDSIARRNSQNGDQLEEIPVCSR